MKGEKINPLLQLDAEQMRAFGYRVVDLLVEHLATLREQPVGRTASRAHLEQRLREPLPEQPSDAGQVLETLRAEVLENTLHVNHPRFFGFIPGPGNYVSAMVEALANGFKHHQSANHRGRRAPDHCPPHALCARVNHEAQPTT